MVKESTIALGLTALGVAFTGVIAFALARQAPVPGVAQVQPRPVLGAPLYATQSESQLASMKWNDVHRRQPAMFGGTTGYGSQSSGGQPASIVDRKSGLSMIGGVQGFSSTASGGQTQFQPAGSNPLYTGTRYGKMLGLSAGPRFQNEGPVPVY